MDKIKHTDPFLGEIELTKICETSMHAVGESIVHSIYQDFNGDYYIDTWSTTGYAGKTSMIFLPKNIINKIIEIKNKDNKKDSTFS